MIKYYVSPSATVTKLLMDLAEDKGWTVCKNFKEEHARIETNGTLTWPIFVFEPNYELGENVWGRYKHHGDGEQINLEEMVKCLEKEKKYQISEFKLNKDYTAIIDKHNKTVKVGCQTFSFDILWQLVAKFD